MAHEQPVLELSGITKAFPGVLANAGIDLEVRRGEIHALLGENGAGKSTLMNILTGLYRPDAGEIIIDGTPITFASPIDAIAAGIGMVHQHFILVRAYHGRREHPPRPSPRRAGHPRQLEARTRLLLATTFSFAVDAAPACGTSAGGTAASGDPARALPRDARILILDEPTAVLTPARRMSCSRSATFALAATPSSSSATSSTRSSGSPIASRSSAEAERVATCRGKARPRQGSPG